MFYPRYIGYQEFAVTTDASEQSSGQEPPQQSGEESPLRDKPSEPTDTYVLYLKTMIANGWVQYRLNLQAISNKMREQGKSPEVVAQLALLNHNSVRKILDGQTRFPTTRAIEGIAYALNCGVANITEGGYFEQKG